ncbi:hypothetical protein SAMN05421749_101410 [Acinetobacter marinus]|uniref:DUF4034 domain-containing protein n=1 Tax=Acinetobacter marinus TaxID=281375 RepID=A0A1G6GTN6_9GAMM|nr:hypothetical protein [Acinetobacter marinus]SDB85367.1 hypothetical protein SAMN05421749_101410 [Acinetobacter marinus]
MNNNTFSARTSFLPLPRATLAVPLTVLGLALGYSQSSHASPDTSCTPILNLSIEDYDRCSNMPILASGNDNQTNVALLLADRNLLKINPNKWKNDGYALDYGLVPFGQSDLTLLLENTQPNRRQKFINDDSLAYDEHCNSLIRGVEGFEHRVKQLNISASEQSKLIALRKGFNEECDGQFALIKVDDAWSQTTRLYASYLNASIAFYNSDFATAEKIYQILAQSDDPWVKETAQYMLIRVAVNQAYQSGLGKYGNLDRSKIDQSKLTKLFKSITAYLNAYPQGQYVASARGFLRRGYWIGGHYDKLGNELMWQINHTKHNAYNLDMEKVPAEFDRYLFSSKGFQGQNLQDPFLLAVYDLMQMRKTNTFADYDDKSYRPLSWSALQAQQKYFKSEPELFRYLQAWHLFTLQNKPNDALNFLPKSQPKQINSYLELSQVVLKGRILEAQNSADYAKHEQYWKSVMPLAKIALSREMLELPLAISMQNDRNYAGFTAKNSLIQQPNLRRIFIQNVADANTLQSMASSTSTPKDERYHAIFSLLQQSLLQQDYALFVKSYSLLPSDAAKYKSWDSSDESLYNKPPLSVFTWSGTTISPTIQCSSLLNIAKTLAQKPNDALAQLCIGEMLRNREGSYYYPFYPYEQFNSLSSATFGDVKTAFWGTTFNRGDIYQRLIKQPKSDPLRPYALYRAIRCYAPSGLNDCQNTDVEKSVRKSWFDQLKQDYPQTTWAKELQYYW